MANERKPLPLSDFYTIKNLLVKKREALSHANSKLDFDKEIKDIDAAIKSIFDLSIPREDSELKEGNVLKNEAVATLIDIAIILRAKLLEQQAYEDKAPKKITGSIQTQINDFKTVVAPIQTLIVNAVKYRRILDQQVFTYIGKRLYVQLTGFIDNASKAAENTSSDLISILNKHSLIAVAERIVAKLKHKDNLSKHDLMERTRLYEDNLSKLIEVLDRTRLITLFLDSPLITKEAKLLEEKINKNTLLDRLLFTGKEPQHYIARPNISVQSRARLLILLLENLDQTIPSIHRKPGDVYRPLLTKKLFKEEINIYVTGNDHAALINLITSLKYSNWNWLHDVCTEIGKDGSVENMAFQAQLAEALLRHHAAYGSLRSDQLEELIRILGPTKTELVYQIATTPPPVDVKPIAECKAKQSMIAVAMLKISSTLKWLDDNSISFQPVIDQENAEKLIKVCIEHGRYGKKDSQAQLAKVLLRNYIRQGSFSSSQVTTLVKILSDINPELVYQIAIAEPSNANQATIAAAMFHTPSALEWLLGDDRGRNIRTILKKVNQHTDLVTILSSINPELVYQIATEEPSHANQASIAAAMLHTPSTLEWLLGDGRASNIQAILKKVNQQYAEQKETERKGGVYSLENILARYLSPEAKIATGKPSVSSPSISASASRAGAGTPTHRQATISRETKSTENLAKKLLIAALKDIPRDPEQRQLNALLNSAAISAHEVIELFKAQSTDTALAKAILMSPKCLDEVKGSPETFKLLVQTAKGLNELFNGPYRTDLELSHKLFSAALEYDLMKDLNPSQITLWLKDLKADGGNLSSYLDSDKGFKPISSPSSPRGSSPRRISTEIKEGLSSMPSSPKIISGEGKRSGEEKLAIEFKWPPLAQAILANKKLTEELLTNPVPGNNAKQIIYFSMHDAKWINVARITDDQVIAFIPISHQDTLDDKIKAAAIDKEFLKIIQYHYARAQAGDSENRVALTHLITQALCSDKLFNRGKDSDAELVKLLDMLPEPQEIAIKDILNKLWKASGEDKNQLLLHKKIISVVHAALNKDSPSDPNYLYWAVTQEKDDEHKAAGLAQPITGEYYRNLLTLKYHVAYPEEDYFSRKTELQGVLKYVKLLVTGSTSDVAVEKIAKENKLTASLRSAEELVRAGEEKEPQETDGLASETRNTIIILLLGSREHTGLLEALIKSGYFGKKVDETLIENIRSKIRAAGEETYEIELLDDEKEIKSAQLKPGKIYIQPDDAQLNYRIIDVDGKLQHGAISWTSLPSLPKDAKEIQSKQIQFIPKILAAIEEDYAIESLGDEKEIKNENIQPGKIYIRINEHQLDYSFINVEGNAKRGIIPRSSLPSFPKDVKAIQSEKYLFLPKLLEVIGKEQITKHIHVKKPVFSDLERQRGEGAKDNELSIQESTERLVSEMVLALNHLHNLDIAVNECHKLANVHEIQTRIISALRQLTELNASITYICRYCPRAAESFKAYFSDNIVQFERRLIHRAAQFTNQLYLKKYSHIPATSEAKVLEFNKIYIGVKDDYITYSMKTDAGNVYNQVTTIKAPKPLTEEDVNHLFDKVWDEATNNRHAAPRSEYLDEEKNALKSRRTAALILQTLIDDADESNKSKKIQNFIVDFCTQFENTDKSNGLLELYYASHYITDPATKDDLLHELNVRFIESNGIGTAYNYALNHSDLLIRKSMAKTILKTIHASDFSAGCDLYLMPSSESKTFVDSDEKHLRLYRTETHLVYYLNGNPYTLDIRKHSNVANLFSKPELLGDEGSSILKEGILKNTAAIIACKDILQETFIRGHTQSTNQVVRSFEGREAKSIGYDKLANHKNVLSESEELPKLLGILHPNVAIQLLMSQNTKIRAERKAEIKAILEAKKREYCRTYLQPYINSLTTEVDAICADKRPEHIPQIASDVEELFQASESAEDDYKPILLEAAEDIERVTPLLARYLNDSIKRELRIYGFRNKNEQQIAYDYLNVDQPSAGARMASKKVMLEQKEIAERGDLLTKLLRNLLGILSNARTGMPEATVKTHTVIQELIAKAGPLFAYTIYKSFEPPSEEKKDGRDPRSYPGEQARVAFAGVFLHDAKHFNDILNIDSYAFPTENPDEYKKIELQRRGNGQRRIEDLVNTFTLISDNYDKAFKLFTDATFNVHTEAKRMELETIPFTPKQKESLARAMFKSINMRDRLLNDDSKNPEGIDQFLSLTQAIAPLFTDINRDTKEDAKEAADLFNNWRKKDFDNALRMLDLNRSPESQARKSWILWEMLSQTCYSLAPLPAIKTPLNNHRDPRKLYVRSTSAGLLYEIIDLNNQLQINTIPWRELPGFPRDIAELQSKLPDLLQLMATKGLVPPLAGLPVEEQNTLISQIDFTTLSSEQIRLLPKALRIKILQSISLEPAPSREDERKAPRMQEIPWERAWKKLSKAQFSESKVDDLGKPLLLPKAVALSEGLTDNDMKELSACNPALILAFNQNNRTEKMVDILLSPPPKRRAIFDLLGEINSGFLIRRDNTSLHDNINANRGMPPNRHRNRYLYKLILASYYQPDESYELMPNALVTKEIAAHSSEFIEHANTKAFEFALKDIVTINQLAFSHTQHTHKNKLDKVITAAPGKGITAAWLLSTIEYLKNIHSAEAANAAKALINRIPVYLTNYQGNETHQVFELCKKYREAHPVTVNAENFQNDPLVKALQPDNKSISGTFRLQILGKVLAMSGQPLLEGYVHKKGSKHGVHDHLAWNITKTVLWGAFLGIFIYGIYELYNRLFKKKSLFEHLKDKVFGEPPWISAVKLGITGILSAGSMAAAMVAGWGVAVWLAPIIVAGVAGIIATGGLKLGWNKIGKWANQIKSSIKRTFGRTEFDDGEAEYNVLLGYFKQFNDVKDFSTSFQQMSDRTQKHFLNLLVYIDKCGFDFGKEEGVNSEILDRVTKLRNAHFWKNQSGIFKFLLNTLGTLLYIGPLVFTAAFVTIYGAPALLGLGVSVYASLGILNMIPVLYPLVTGKILPALPFINILQGESVKKQTSKDSGAITPSSRLSSVAVETPHSSLVGDTTRALQTVGFGRSDDKKEEVAALPDRGQAKEQKEPQPLAKVEAPHFGRRHRGGRFPRRPANPPTPASNKP